MGCTNTGTLIEVREYLAKQYEFSAFQHHYDDAGGEDMVLLLWLVHPDIDPAVDEFDEFQEYQYSSTMLAAHTVMNLANDIPCVRQIYDAIAPNVVDRDYNSWLAMRFEINSLPDRSDLSDLELVTEVLAKVDEGNAPQYMAKPPSEYDFGPKPDDACTWPEVREAIEAQYADVIDLANYGFTYYHMGNSTLLMGQIEYQYEEFEPFMEQTGVVTWNVMIETECIYPAIDEISLFFVDPYTADMRYWGHIPGNAKFDKNDPTTLPDLMIQLELEEYTP